MKRQQRLGFAVCRSTLCDEPRECVSSDRFLQLSWLLQVFSRLQYNTLFRRFCLSVIFHMRSAVPVLPVTGD